MAALHSGRGRNQHHSRVAHQPNEQHQRHHQGQNRAAWHVEICHHRIDQLETKPRNNKKPGESFAIACNRV